MFAKLVDFSELSKLLSVKSKMSVGFVPIRSFWPSWVAKALPLSLLDDRGMVFAIHSSMMRGRVVRVCPRGQGLSNQWLQQSA